MSEQPMIQTTDWLGISAENVKGPEDLPCPTCGVEAGKACIYPSRFKQWPSRTHELRRQAVPIALAVREREHERR